MWAYLVIIRFLFCLIIDIVVFHIRFQIMVSVISMEGSHPFATTATEKYLKSRYLPANFRRHKQEIETSKTKYICLKRL